VLLERFNVRLTPLHPWLVHKILHIHPTHTALDDIWCLDILLETPILTDDHRLVAHSRLYSTHPDPLGMGAVHIAVTRVMDRIKLLICNQPIDDDNVRPLGLDILATGSLQNKSSIWQVQIEKSLDEQTDILARISKVAYTVKLIRGLVPNGFWHGWIGDPVSQDPPVTRGKLARKHSARKLTRAIDDV
jgi:hypothetical protein